ncbi:MAG: cytochrome B [Bacteroidota bacterium]
MLHNILKHAHSGWRWIVLALLVFAIFNAFRKWRSGAEFQESDRKLNIFTLSAVHIQFVFGLILYFISPWVVFSGEAMKDALLRFYTVEHFLTMLIGVAVISIGYSRAKRAVEAGQKFRTTFVFFLIGLLIILARIPWPFMEKYQGGWF